MDCKAILTKVNDRSRIRAKLPAWTSDDPDKIIDDVRSGKERVITTLNCDGCKEDLEKYGAAVVRIDKNGN